MVDNRMREREFMANWKEEWKPINGHPSYNISNKGNVYSRHNFRNIQHILSGSLKVSLSLDGKNKRYDVAQLVAEHFLDKPEGANFLWFKDGNYQNVKYTNLEWVTSVEFHRRNQERFPRPIKVTPDDLDLILKYRIDGAELVEISEVFKISSSYASRVCRSNLAKHKVKTPDGNRRVRYWYKDESPPDVWPDGSVTIKSRPRKQDAG